MLAELRGHPGQCLQDDRQAVAVIERVLAGSCLARKCLAARSVAPQPRCLAQVVKRESAYPEFAEALARRQALLAEFNRTVQLAGGGQDTAEGAPGIQLDLSDVHQLG